MKSKHSLATRTEKFCPQCGQKFILAGPTDALGGGPAQVDLVCPECHFPGRATLTDERRLQSVFPSPDAASPLGVALDDSGWLAGGGLDSLATLARHAITMPEAEFSSAHSLN